MLKSAKKLAKCCERRLEQSFCPAGFDPKTEDGKKTACDTVDRKAALQLTERQLRRESNLTIVNNKIVTRRNVLKRTGSVNQMVQQQVAASPTVNDN